MEELNTPIFAQAKVEYTKQLIEILYPHMFDGVKSIYDESKIIYSSKTGTPILLLFRELLEKVPIWNSEIIDSECSRIINNSKCDWIDDLITAVFISHTKILTSIGPNQSFQKINVTIPKTSSFVHKAYINSARELWKNPYLFNENVPGHEYQRNSKEIENIIKNCIENTIRHLLPIKEILKEHLDTESDNNLLNQKEEIKKLLRDELKELKSHVKLNENSEGEEEEDDELPENNNKSTVQKEDVNLDPVIKKEDEEDINLEPVIKKDDNEEEILEGELLPLLAEKLEEITEKDKEDKEDKEDIDNTNLMFPSSDDPTDEQVEKQCSDIVVNDITIPVEIPNENEGNEETKELPKEEKYDNVDVTIDTKEEEDPDRLKRLMTNMEVKEEVNVIKSENNIEPENQQVMNPDSGPNFPPLPIQEPAPEPTPSFSFNSLYPNMNKDKPISVEKVESIPELSVKPTPELSVKPTPELSVKPPPELSVKPTPEPLKIISEDKPIENQLEEPKSPRKDIVTVKNEDDIDETSSLAHFFNDMKQIVEDKGIKIETNKDNNFTLFEDAPSIEK